MEARQLCTHRPSKTSSSGDQRSLKANSTSHSLQLKSLLMSNDNELEGNKKVTLFESTLPWFLLETRGS